MYMQTEQEMLHPTCYDDEYKEPPSQRFKIFVASGQNIL